MAELFMEGLSKFALRVLLYDRAKASDERVSEYMNKEVLNIHRFAIDMSALLMHDEKAVCQVAE